jgi:hypothetical protein
MSYSRSYTFWRFAIQVPLGPTEMQITYSINHGQELEFYVPGRNQNMRWAAHSVSDCSEQQRQIADHLNSATGSVPG